MVDQPLAHRLRERRMGCETRLVFTHRTHRVAVARVLLAQRRMALAHVVDHLLDLVWEEKPRFRSRDLRAE